MQPLQLTFRSAYIPSEHTSPRFTLGSVSTTTRRPSMSCGVGFAIISIIAVSSITTTACHGDFYYVETKSMTFGDLGHMR